MTAGPELPLLLAAAFRVVVDELHAELEGAGHPGVRPVHGFALQALGRDGTTATELARRLGVSKQAASKTLTSLDRLGYVARSADPSDGRRQVLHRTPRGEDCLRRSATILDGVWSRLAEELGQARLHDLEASLRAVVGDSPWTRLGDLPGWMR